MSTPAERQRAYRARLAASDGRQAGKVGRPKLPADHGTGTAWRRHQLEQTPICDACRAWRTAYVRDLRAR